MTDRVITKGKLYYSVLAPVWKKLADIPYAVIKGEPLSVQLYGCCGRRDYSDVDILLPRSELKAVQKILLEEGFKPVDSSRAKAVFYQLYSHQTMPYYRSVGNIPIYVDLNTDLLWGEYTGRRIDITGFLSDVESMRIYDQPVKVLPPDKVLIQFVLHCFRDMNSVYLLDLNHGYRRKMFDELHILLAKFRHVVTPDTLESRCLKYGISDCVYHVIWALQEIFKEDWIQPYVDILRSNEGEVISKCFGLDTDERREWAIAFQERFEIDDFYLLLHNQGEEELCRKIELNRHMIGEVEDGEYQRNRCADYQRIPAGRK